MTENFALCAKYAKITTIETYEIHKDSVKYLGLLFILYCFLINVSQLLYIFNAYLLFSVYWLLMGVMATIGLGTGMYTGTFYLFPFILSIKTQGELCNNLDLVY